MQKNSASSKTSTEILKQAIQFIGRHNLTATPINYTVSYEYCRGEHTLLRQAVELAIANKHPIDNDVMQRWFDNFLLGFDLKIFSKSKIDLNKIANQLAITTTKAEEHVIQFDNSLKECKSGLSEAPNISSLSSIVSLLVTSTTSMQIAMEKMKQQITTSQQEIASLNRIIARSLGDGDHRSRDRSFNRVNQS